MNKKLVLLYLLLILFSVSFNGLYTSWAKAESAPDTVALSTPGIWTVVPSYTTEHLNSVSMVSVIDGWAVGDNGTFLRWNGSGWTSVSGATTNKLLAVAMSSATDGWATDVGILNQGKILHWDGNEWSISLGNNAFLSALSIVPGSNGSSVYAAGWWGSIWHWNGSSWSSQSSINLVMLYGIEMISETDGWAVGGMHGQDETTGVILHWDGSSWQQVVGPETGHWYNAIAAVANDNVWIVGRHGTILHWNGSSWSMVSSPTTNDLTGISMVPGSNGMQGWAVGNSDTILHWDGNTWSPVSSPVTQTLKSVTMISATEGWAVGQSGTILHYTNSRRVYLPLVIR